MFVVLSLSKVLATALFILLFLCSLQLLAQNNNRFDEPITEEHYEFLKKKKELIEQEDASDNNEWSGTYSAGDHHPTLFMWSATQGFLTWGSHHTFFPSRINFGKAEFSNARLVIKPEISKEHLNFQYISTELVTVKWGEQHFLIPSDELINFAYAVHSGAQSQIVGYFVKSEDYQKSRQGLPNLPKEYEKFLTMKAIKPKITSIKDYDENNFWSAEIILSLGRASNIVKGMIFYYINSSGSMQLMVTEVQEKSSKAKISGISGGKREEIIKPKVGMKFTSKIPADYIDF